MSEANEFNRKKGSINRTVPGNATRAMPTDSSTLNQPETEPSPTDEVETALIPTTIDYSVTPDSTLFGINEFARLHISIRDDKDARSAVIAMGQELTRSQLDTGVTRGDFWRIVESRFNDSTQRRFLSLAGAVDDVDSSLPPLAHRTSTFLKEGGLYPECDALVRFWT